MAKAGYCKECGKNVWLKEDGSCQFGHSTTVISNLYETYSGKLKREDEKSIHGISLVAFIFGVISFFTGCLVIPGLVALILGIIALSTFNNEVHKGKWMAIVAVVLGVIYGIFVPVATALLLSTGNY